MRGNQNRTTRTILRDAALIAALLLTAGILFFVTAGRPHGAYVVVRVDGTETGRYALDQSGIYELNGGSNILQIENGFAFLCEADCPDKLCVRQGKIRLNGQCIICLPNRLTVTVCGAEDGADVIS